MLTLGPYATLGLYVAAIWIFIISGAFLCVLVGWLGSKWHRRKGRKCPECDYMSDPVDVLTHHTLEHWDHDRE